MVRRLITILLFFSLILPILADSSITQLPTAVTMKLKNGDKLKTYILCFTDHGFVTWNSTVYNPDQDMDKFAEYYSYEQLDHIKMPGRINLLPAILGSTIGVINLGSFDESEDLGPAIGAVFLISLGAVVSFLTIFIPRSLAPTSKLEAEKLPKKYSVYQTEVPTVVSEFIAEYEK